MTATIHHLPPVYYVAYTDGDRLEYLEDFETRSFWEAEDCMRAMAVQYPDLLFWVIMKGVPV